MDSRRKLTVLLVATVAASLLAVGAVTGTVPGEQGASPTDSIDSQQAVSDTASSTDNVAQSTQNESNDSTLPVEPPTNRSLPTYDEVRRDGDTEAKVELGQMLYHDPRISETGSISCNSCHNTMEGGDGSRTVGRGVHGQTGPRNSPTVWNSAFMATQFWDGRADSLAQQAKGPITAGVEMGMPSSEAAMDRIRNNSGYVTMFEEVYGGENPVTLNNTVDAIAAYERTLITPNSSYDEYVEGDADALSEQQVDGMQKFKELGCASCHSGPAFNGPQWKVATGEREEGNGYYERLGVFESANARCANYVEEYNLFADSGRADVTGESADEHVFKVPTLRNTEITAPYFHNGKVRELDTAIKVMASCQLNENISDQDANDIEAFLTSLTGEFPEQTMPRIPSASGGPPMIPETAGDASEPGSDDGGSESVGTPDDGDSGTQADGDSEATTTSGSGPGFTVAVAVAALVAALALVGVRRRQSD
jgi:cytochrome c peroxidase